MAFICFSKTTVAWLCLVQMLYVCCGDLLKNFEKGSVSHLLLFLGRYGSTIGASPMEQEKEASTCSGQGF